MAKPSRSREARHGEKMIELKVRFFTNGLAESQGEIRPKHAWTRGVVRIKRNAPHEIAPGRALHFNSLMEIPGLIEKVLVQHEIKLHVCSKMEKYVSPSW